MTNTDLCEFIIVSLSVCQSKDSTELTVDMHSVMGLSGAQVFLNSTTIFTNFRVFSSRMFWLHQMSKFPSAGRHGIIGNDTDIF